ncbi:hypothetical protein PHSY_000158 [Pseudozyma hubeiensis SY62]|uniref:Uncharacterized protein n=1 Tax=Pseudozyma hubeiensis (strain SY62) TaxID=1305764 RepID=R9NVU5_PSEHS|nr:hypothetical protein PHSY_000158 [Pseudozyma hubeiensis SY62]GAC92604.1 hypothetical protein PHSY_000158 [Pseudozyma hubeiensis SY62]
MTVGGRNLDLVCEGDGDSAEEGRVSVGSHQKTFAAQWRFDAASTIAFGTGQSTVTGFCDIVCKDEESDVPRRKGRSYASANQLVRPGEGTIFIRHRREYGVPSDHERHRVEAT